jgi:xanthine dehydrogenase YagS FAD-binding subunit
MQRTRCYYFYDPATPCNKREPGQGCSAIAGFNRSHAILGTSDECIAVHPSDMCVALAALEARVLVTGPGGERTIPFLDFHRLPGDRPQIDTNLRADELITAVDLPAKGFASHCAYIKVRDRESYAFALVSVAAAVEMDGEQITDCRLALGGVAHKPWRDKRAEATLTGQRATPESFARLANEILKDAKGFGHNDFKIELARRAIARALTDAAAGEGRP